MLYWRGACLFFSYFFGIYFSETVLYCYLCSQYYHDCIYSVVVL
jgi:hypothetical protein